MTLSGNLLVYSNDCSPAGCFGSCNYTPEEASGPPPELLRASLGCGNPTALANLQDGEVVLDLGSGAGLDVLLSARRPDRSGIPPATGRGGFHRRRTGGNAGPRPVGPAGRVPERRNGKATGSLCRFPDQCLRPGAQTRKCGVKRFIACGCTVSPSRGKRPGGWPANIPGPSRQSLSAKSKCRIGTCTCRPCKQAGVMPARALSCLRRRLPPSRTPRKKPPATPWAWPSPWPLYPARAPLPQPRLRGARPPPCPSP